MRTCVQLGRHSVSSPCFLCFMCDLNFIYTELTDPREYTEGAEMIFNLEILRMKKSFFGYCVQMGRHSVPSPCILCFLCELNFVRTEFTDHTENTRKVQR